MHLCTLSAWPQSHVHTNVHLCVYVCLRAMSHACPLCMHTWAWICQCSWFFSCVNAHLFFYGSVTVYPVCSACVQKTDTSVLWCHKWTLDLLDTCWRPANLAYIVYPSLYTMTGMADSVYSLLCAASRLTSQRDNLSCVLWPTPSSGVASSGSISCLFLRGELEPRLRCRPISYCEILKF